MVKDFTRYTEPRGVSHGADRGSRDGIQWGIAARRALAAARSPPGLRATVQASLRTGGEPVHRRWRAPTRRPANWCWSATCRARWRPTSRMLLQYMQASVAARRRVEAFAFGTRLTRITHELREGRDPDHALERADRRRPRTCPAELGSATPWSTLNRVHGRRLGRGSVVVILSDGWDRGEPDQLRAEMARLRRAAFKLVWLNPLAAHPDYEPLTRGMQAAVPHTDRLLAGNSIASLQELAEILEEM